MARLSRASAMSPGTSIRADEGGMMKEHYLSSRFSLKRRFSQYIFLITLVFPALAGPLYVPCYPCRHDQSVQQHLYRSSTPVGAGSHNPLCRGLALLSRNSRQSCATTGAWRHVQQQLLELQLPDLSGECVLVCSEYGRKGTHDVQL